MKRFYEGRIQYPSDETLQALSKFQPFEPVEQPDNLKEGYVTMEKILRNIPKTEFSFIGL